MLVLAGTIAILLGVCMIAAGTHEKKDKEKEEPKEEKPET